MTARQLWLGCLGGLGVLFAVGCGGDDPPPEPQKDAVCEQRTAALGTLREKAAPCPSVTVEESTVCSNASTRCREADKGKLEQFYTCLEQVPACVAGEELAFVGAQGLCTDKLRGLSEVCAHAVGIKEVPPSSGSIQVDIEALAYVPAAVTLSGPNGFSRTLAASAILTELPPGDYTVKAEGGRKESPAGTTFYDVAVSAPSVTVDYGKTAAVAVRYTPNPRSAQLWITNTSLTTSSVSAGMLDANPALVRPEWAQVPEAPVSLSDVSAFARDAAGDVWVANCRHRLVSKFRQQDLVSSGSPQPLVTLEAGNHLGMPLPVFCGIKGLAFDSQGTLWVSGGRRLAGYSPAQQQAGGSVSAPAVLVTLEAPDSTSTVMSLSGLAFDAAGNLWVANEWGDTVHMLAPEQLQSSIVPVKPRRNLSSTLESLASPTALAFVGDTLWVANSRTSKLSRFSASQLLQDGRPTPALVASGDFIRPTGLAVDDAGTLWVVSNGDFGESHLGDVQRLTREDLQRTGTAFLVAEARFRPVSHPQALLFVEGDLLVSSSSAFYSEDVDLVRVPASELTKSPPTPSARFKAPTPERRSTEDMVFDAQGALWLSDFVAQKVFKYRVEQSAPLIRSAPVVTLTLGQDQSAGPIAFDAAGNLWMGGVGLSQYAAGRLGSSSSAPPDATLQSGVIVALAFNAQDELFAVRSDGRVVKYTASDRQPAGAPSSVGTLSFAYASPVRLVFAPAGELLVTLGTEGKLLRFPPERLTPGNFSPTATVEGLARPTSIAFDASQRIWVATTNGLLRLPVSGQLQSGPVQAEATLPNFYGGILAFRPASP